MCDKKIPEFTESEQDYVIKCLAYGMRPVHVAELFFDQFPVFAEDREMEVRRKTVLRRACGYLNDSRRPPYKKIQEIRKSADPEFGDIPLANPWVRLNVLQQLYNNLPLEIEETVVETIESSKGTTTKTKVTKKSSIPYVLSIIGMINRILKNIEYMPVPSWNPDASQVGKSEPTGPRFSNLNKKKGRSLCNHSPVIHSVWVTAPSRLTRPERSPDGLVSGAARAQLFTPSSRMPFRTS